VLLTKPTKSAVEETYNRGVHFQAKVVSVHDLQDQPLQ